MAWFHNRIVLPLAAPERHRGLSARLRELERFERLAEAEQRAFQTRLVCKILAHAYQTVPYYRRLFDDAGFTPEQWVAGGSIPIAVSDKESMRANPETTLSTAIAGEDLHPATSGGTTSTPVRLYRDGEGLRQKIALQYHLNRLTGYDQGDRVLLVWGAERDLELAPSWRWKLYDQTIMGHIPAPAGQIDDEVFRRFRDRLNRYKPRVVYGYGNTISRFASFLAQDDKPYHKPSLVIVTAEATTPAERAQIEREFGCRVFEHYGSREIGMVAFECSAGGGMHFHPAGCMVEFEYAGRDSGGPMHRLIVTDLLNYGMPLVRFDTGDYVRLAEGACACGRWYPKVAAILGRSTDSFFLADGTEIPGIALGCHITPGTETFRHVIQVQVIQKEFDRIEVRYVANSSGDAMEDELAVLRKSISNAANFPFQWTMVRVEDIPRAPSGKLRLCVSEVQRPVRPGPRVSC